MSLEPNIAAALPGLPRFDWIDPVTERRQMRALLEEHTGIAVPGEDRLEIEDRQIADGLTVRLYLPRERSTTVPGVLFFHGGGFTAGDLDTEHGMAVRTACDGECAVVSVDYRLAPEHPFPAALDGGWTALQWLSDSARELDIDSTRLGVAGGSAGANLAAATALLARDRGGPRLVFQLLVVPVLDHRCDTQSMRARAATPVIAADGIARAWHWYLGTDRSDVSPYASPMRATDLRGLPPAYIETAEYDPLRDEGILYALRLLNDGVPVELHQYPNAFHGSVELVPHVMRSQQALAARRSALRCAFARGPQA
jgi:acetyl esterase/lipase